MSFPTIDGFLDASQNISSATANDSDQVEESPALGDVSTPHEVPLQILRQNAAPLAECFYIGILLGITDGQFGVILPSIKEYYHISDGAVSALFMCQAAGYFVAAFGNGWIVCKLNQVGALYLGGGMIVVAYVLLLLGLPFPAMCCFMPFLGGGFGFSWIQALMFFLPHCHTQLHFLTCCMHFMACFPLKGSLIGPLMASSLHARHISWKVSYMILAVMAVMNLAFLFLAFRGVRFGEYGKLEDEAQQSEDGDKQQKPSEQRGPFAQTIRLKVTWILAIFLLFYVGVEVTIGGWGYTFLTTARNGDPVQMGRIMSAYWAGITVGRVILGHITGILGEKRMVLVYLLITCGMVVLIWQTNTVSSNAAGLVILGIFLGPVLPTAISFSHQTLPKHLHAVAVGFLVAFGQAGAAFFPFFSGQVIDKAGVASIMPYTFGLAIVMLISWVLVPTTGATFAFFYRFGFKRWKK